MLDVFSRQRFSIFVHAMASDPAFYFFDKSDPDRGRLRLSEDIEHQNMVGIGRSLLRLTADWETQRGMG
jgi:hypothetical protein